MDTETLAVLISFAVLVLQIIQVMRYVKLESEVKRVTTELDQTLNRLHRALELTREIHLCQLRHFLYLMPLPQQPGLDDAQKYEFISNEAENRAKSNGYMIELRAIAMTIGDAELIQLLQELSDWIDNAQPGYQFGDLNNATEKVQARIYKLINDRLSSKI